MPLAMEAESMSDKTSIKEIEVKFGFDKITPIPLTTSEEKEEIKKGDYFRDWYEEELRRIDED